MRRAVRQARAAQACVEPSRPNFMVGNFDSPADFAPQCHIFAGEPLPWLHFADGPPCYRTVPSAGDLMKPQRGAGISQ